MHVEDQLWISDQLGVELPDPYAIEMIHFPFLDHEGTAELDLWDDGHTIISTTKSFRQGTDSIAKWPDQWICVGKCQEGYYVLNCDSYHLILAVRGDLQDVKIRWYGGSVQPIIDDIHDGYRGKLPEGMARKDSSFKPVSVITEISWDPPYTLRGTIHPFEEEVLIRIHQSSHDRLCNWLKAKRIHYIEFDGLQMTDKDAFFDHIGAVLSYDVNWWPNVWGGLEKYIEPIAQGGLMQAVILFNHADKVFSYSPTEFVDAAAFFHELDLLDETGCLFQTFFLGSDESIFKVKIADSDV